MSDDPILRPTLPPNMITDPDNPTSVEKNTSKLNRLIWGKDLNTYVKRINEYDRNKSTIYYITLG